MLSDDKLFALIEKAQQGDAIAREELIAHNLNLVRSIVHRFMGRGYEWDDLFQLGCIGLFKAVERFDCAFGVKFSTYAVPMIIGEIRRFIRDDNPVKVSRPVKELSYRIHKTQEELQAKHGREATVPEIAAELQLAPQEVVAALDAMQPLLSLQEQVFQQEGDGIIRLDQLAGADMLGNGYLDALTLREAISCLPDKEKIIIKQRFFADKTQSEVAAGIGLSQVQVSRLEKTALKKIRALLKGNHAE